MRSSFRSWIIQLEPCKSKVPVITRRMQQVLRNLTLRARVDGTTTDSAIAGVTKRDRSDRLDRLRSAVPSVLVLVDRGRKRGDVELVWCLTPKCPRSALRRVGVDVELQLTLLSVVGWDVEGNLGVFLGIVRYDRSSVCTRFDHLLSDGTAQLCPIGFVGSIGVNWDDEVWELPVHKRTQGWQGEEDRKKRECMHRCRCEV